jgi:hypothetical protein
MLQVRYPDGVSSEEGMIEGSYHDMERLKTVRALGMGRAVGVGGALRTGNGL